MEDETEEVELVEEEVQVPRPARSKKQDVVVDDVPDFIRAENGDSYLTIALRFCGDVKPSEFARSLLAINNGAVVRAGSKIFLKEKR